MQCISRWLLTAFTLFAADWTQAATEAVMVPLKSDQTLPYTDMYAFSYKSNEMDALWLMIPPLLETDRDLPNALFQFNNRGMTAEILKSPIPQLPAPEPAADAFDRTIQLHKTAAIGLLSTISLTADYGTALTLRLKELASADPGFAKLKQKMLRLDLGKGSQGNVPKDTLVDWSKPKVYDDSVPLTEARNIAADRKIADLAKALVTAIQSRSLDLYEVSAVRLLALQDEGGESSGPAQKLLAGHHVNGVLRGLPTDALIDALLTTGFLNTWDAYDLVDLNKIILLSGKSIDRSRLTAGLMLVRASVEKNPNDRYLIVSGVLKRLLNNESTDSLVSDISRLSYFGSNTGQVNQTLQDLLKLWK